jgi:hypothetical protein
MESLHRAGSELYSWQQPTAFKRFFTLRAGDACYATLHWENVWSLAARASTADGRWEFAHQGFLRSRILVRETEANGELGHFLTRRYGGLLTIGGKELYRWHLSGTLGAESTWVTSQGSPLLHCTRQHWSITKARVVVAPQAATVPDLPLLVVLDWYIRLMMFAVAGVLLV